jgi:hypothetical protein
MRCSSWKLLGLFAMALVIAPPAHAEILIGDASDVTGPVAWAGEQAVVGTQLAVADLNPRVVYSASRSG